MVVDTTLYDVLGVEPNANQETISKAVKTKSLEHHPDRGGTHEMMQQVNAAKEILTDPQKRRIYDQYGLDGIKSRISHEDSEFSNIFSSFFDIFHLFNDERGHANRSKNLKGTDIKRVLKVSLEDLYMGRTEPVEIDRNVICNDCKGTGCSSGIEHTCTNCHGRGIEISIQRFGLFVQHMQKECSLCNGHGTIILPENRCINCHGKKISQETKILNVNIQRGTQNGETIEYPNEGNQFPKSQPGSVYITIEEKSHPIFRRNNDNLIMKMEINLTESLCGFRRVIKLLDGQQTLINHPPGKPILPNSYHTIKGYGMPNKQTRSFGDLIINFDVIFPEKNFIKTEKQLQQLQSVLPPKLNVVINTKERYKTPEMIECDTPEENFQQQQHHHFHHDDGADFNPQFHNAQWQGRQINDLLSFFMNN